MRIKTLQIIQRDKNKGIFSQQFSQFFFLHDIFTNFPTITTGKAEKMAGIPSSVTLN